MESFRTELENPVVQQDILDLEKKIKLFKDGKMDEEKFRSLRLARGVYGQRQQGVQMIRIKIPYGKMTTQQLRRISLVADKYSTGNLHTTTRQDIQIHYVSLDRTPELWAELEKDDVTLREACGNTVRNVTASPYSGINPDEAFDVSPYAHAFFEYFLRNPICQEMGRKFKAAFSSSESDFGLTFMHDLGLVAKIKMVDGKEVRGFKVLVGGGLGSQPFLAHVISEFMPVNAYIPFAEAMLRVFDGFGERNRRMKARLKFLIKDIGLDTFLELVEKEKLALANQTIEVNTAGFEYSPVDPQDLPQIANLGTAYQTWLKGNVTPQKQSGFYSVGIKLRTGDFSTDQARQLADLVDIAADNDIRVTVTQGLLLRYVKKDSLSFVYNRLKEIGIAEAGFESTLDITTCPGTDTCNLGIASSMGASRVLEQTLKEHFPEYVDNKDLIIKISGCMNSCGQHGIAQIGFQGMTIKVGDQVAPALQVLLGGAVLGNGAGQIADKVIKIPSKRGPDALVALLKDYQAKSEKGEKYHEYYKRVGKMYFFGLLKPFADITNLKPSDFIDWGNEEKYKKEIGVGECAGVTIDLVATLLFEVEEKIQLAKNCLANEQFADGIYHAYSGFVNGAKALLTSKGVETNSQRGILQKFEETFGSKIAYEKGFKHFVMQMSAQAPSAAFAVYYVEEVEKFHQRISEFHQKK